MRISTFLIVASLLITTTAIPASPYRRAASSPPMAHHYPKLELSAGLGMIFGGGFGAMGPAASIGYSPAMVGKFPLYVGGEFGLIFNFTPFMLLIPILFKSYMKFGVDRQVDIRGGISLGPTIATSGAAAVTFTFLFEPGIDLWVSNNVALNFDPKFGVMFGTFVFAPRVGVTVPL